MRNNCFFAFAMLLPVVVSAQTQTPAQQQRDDAVGESVNYVFATDLGSGVYDMDGRTLQIYRYTYRKELRTTEKDPYGLRFVAPITAGFFDFEPIDVISNGPPTRVDSLSLVPGVELDYRVRQDWHLIPYARAGFNLASSSVDGWLYGLGLRLEKNDDFHGRERLVRNELALSGVEYRKAVPDDQFMRLRHGVHLAQATGWTMRGHALEVGAYAVFDVILDPPTAPVADAEKQPLQAEFGMTFSTRPRFKIWMFDAPRLGFGYRLAGELSSWRFIIGAPF